MRLRGKTNGLILIQNSYMSLHVTVENISINNASNTLPKHFSHEKYIYLHLMYGRDDRTLQFMTKM